MYKSAIRSLPRRVAVSHSLLRNSQRSINTAPPAQRSRGWKSSAVRWAVAGGGIYYYNTSNVFAEEPEAAIDRLDNSLHAIQESDQPTLGAIVEEKRQRRAQNIAEEQRRDQSARIAVAEGEDAQPEHGEGGLEGLEEEAGQQGAFNPETGEINWDCPCLGGMADGPCGPEFKAAFSCFVYSTEEPKGVECIDKFKGMQDCFRAHPEMYASELDDEEEEELAEEIRASQRSQPVDSNNSLENGTESSGHSTTGTKSSNKVAQEDIIPVSISTPESQHTNTEKASSEVSQSKVAEDRAVKSEQTVRGPSN